MVVLATGWHALALKWPTSTGNQAVIVNELAAVGGMFCSYFLFKKKKNPSEAAGKGRCQQAFRVSAGYDTHGWIAWTAATSFDLRRTLRWESLTLHDWLRYLQ